MRAWQVTKTIFMRLRFLYVFIAIALLVGNWGWIMAVVDKWTRGAAADQVSGEYEWFCPMHPTVVRQADGKCPLCNMALSRRKKGEKAPLPPGQGPRVHLSPYRILQANIATEEVRFRRLVHEIRSVGTIEWDERRIQRVSARVAGRVDELYVNFMGLRVRKGDPLYKLYSPDLVTTQEEYLQALKALEEIRVQKDIAAEARARRLADSARERLKLWGITDAQIAELEKTRKAQTDVVIHSPVSGIVIRKEIDVGQYVAVGQDPFVVVDDSLLWTQVHVFERDLGLVREGQVVEIAAESSPAKTFSGKVVFVAPEVDPETRTAKVRVEFPSPEGHLKSGMYVIAALQVPAGRQGEKAQDKTHAPAPGPAPQERKLYVCDSHPETVSDKPGQCFKGECAGMTLEERRIPAEARVIYVCPDHPETVSDKPGTCPKDQKPLQYKVVSDTSRVVETWVCPRHPERTAAGKEKCPDCGADLKHMELEELLAVPFTSVIDTGTRKVVYVERGHGTFEAVEIQTGPLAVEATGTARREYYPALRGLAAGDRVVTSGAFLLDAETQLTPAGSLYFGAGAHEGHK